MAPDKVVKTTQNILNPLWKPLAGGCNLNRNISEIINENGFKIEMLKTEYISRIRFASFNYLGWAKPN